MQKTFLYWDNLNIYTGAQDVAVAREGAAARRQVRIDFQNLLLLAQAGRPIYRTTASGKINRAFQNVLAQLHNVAAGEKLHPNMLLDRNNHLERAGRRGAAERQQRFFGRPDAPARQKMARGIAVVGAQLQ